ncbi:DNA repair protein RecN [Reinekea blandensis]|uniref:DNA repair protein RecN n=1 Tax=Reinekea blandensis MED297 TaxID=314283 RepID=A4BK71_9GAMM|nr:DNA repair protein RecN [Reinekea blandensis]EAR07500.1 DNA repair protein RecN [Reinekea sp. MED297] [Reinekea blandensis MED297]
MLLNLIIRNIAIADNIDIDWSPGMTSISGETGAGKSILLNSLGLALGERAESHIVRHGEKRAEVVATFQIERIPQAKTWLEARDLDEGDECILRRTVSKEGRSRAFINGQPVPLAELKKLGEFLIDIHSQHAHQSLLRTDTHLRLLDDYAQLNDLNEKVRQKWIAWHGLDRKYQQLKNAVEEAESKRQLLEYQCQELEELNLGDDEVEALEAEFKRFSQSERFLRHTHAASGCLDNDEGLGAVSALKQSLNELRQLDDPSESLSSARSLLESALIQAEEAMHDLQSFADSVEVDEERQFEVESRLNRIHELSRKHQVNSESLPAHFQQLQQELSELDSSGDTLESMENELNIRREDYEKTALILSKKRRKSAVSFQQEVVEKLAQLAMPGANFQVNVTSSGQATSSGMDTVEFMVSLNPGQPIQPLARVASGGELSRISLAIQVICAEHSTIPTLVFDEVDVGISGATAEIVGHMLRSVGQRGQVLCVTHQPQVAALGHHHSIVKKQMADDSTTTRIVGISDQDRVSEIARMLGGIDITAQTMAHAREMLVSHEKSH